MLKKRLKIERNSNDTDDEQWYNHQQLQLLHHHRHNQILPLQPQTQHLNQMQIDRSFNMNERVVTVLDKLDKRVEKLRKDALGLQEQRDYLLISIELFKHDEVMQSMNEYEREEITCYLKRVNSRLSTIELNVKTVRDRDQEESLCQINTMIDSLITSHDPVISRQKCQSFLNACGVQEPNPNYDDNASTTAAIGATAAANTSSSISEHQNEIPAFSIFHDKKFESALLGCTLDDQKSIKKRLSALMDYFNLQTISD